jgi:hypothetical protein
VISIPGAPPRLELRGVTKRFPGVLANDNVSLTVKPGEVNWHPSFAKACEAAKTSGKPVLLFHMMGQLDKQFC